MIKKGIDPNFKSIEKVPKKNKIIIISVFLIILIILITICLIYLFTRETKIEIGEGIENVSLLEKGKVIQINQDKNLNLSDIGKIKFLFIDGEEYFYETEEISYTYKILAESVGLNNFKDIKEIYVIFTYINGTITELPPGTISTGTNTSTSGTVSGGGGGNGNGEGPEPGTTEPSCGDGNCDTDIGETCLSCPEDCLNEENKINVLLVVHSGEGSPKCIELGGGENCYCDMRGITSLIDPRYMVCRDDLKKVATDLEELEIPTLFEFIGPFSDLLYQDPDFSYDNDLINKGHAIGMHGHDDCYYNGTVGYEDCSEIDLDNGIYWGSTGITSSNPTFEEMLGKIDSAQLFNPYNKTIGMHGLPTTYTQNGTGLLEEMNSKGIKIWTGTKAIYADPFTGNCSKENTRLFPHPIKPSNNNYEIIYFDHGPSSGETIPGTTNFDPQSTKDRFSKVYECMQGEQSIDNPYIFAIGAHLWNLKTNIDSDTENFDGISDLRDLKTWILENYGDEVVFSNIEDVYTKTFCTVITENLPTLTSFEVTQLDDNLLVYVSATDNAGIEKINLDSPGGDEYLCGGQTTCEHIFNVDLGSLGSSSIIGNAIRDNKCGDGICDEKEKVNYEICPKDCISDNHLKKDCMYQCVKVNKGPLNECGQKCNVAPPTIQRLKRIQILRYQNLEVSSREELEIRNNKIIMQTKSGDREITVMPETAQNAALRIKYMRNTKIELKEKSGEPIYEMTGERKAKLLGFIPVDKSVTTQINADTVELLSVKESWWAFLSTDAEDDVIVSITVTNINGLTTSETKTCPSECETEITDIPYYTMIFHLEPVAIENPESEISKNKLEGNFLSTKHRVDYIEENNYNIKLSLWFGHALAEYIAENETRMNELGRWVDAGHEIGVHHHDIYKPKMNENPEGKQVQWDGYTYATHEEANKTRVLITGVGIENIEPWGYLGNLTEYMDVFHIFEDRFGIDVNVGIANEQANKIISMPNELIYAAGSGFANNGVPGRWVPDVNVSKGINEYTSTAIVNGIKRNWIAHFSIGSPTLEQEAKDTFTTLNSNVVFTTVTHNFNDFEIFKDYMDFLNSTDPTGEKSVTVNEAVDLLPEEEIELLCENLNGTVCDGKADSPLGCLGNWLIEGDPYWCCNDYCTAESDLISQNTVGFVGCSITHDAVDGYIELGGENIWERVDDITTYGGGSIEIWYNQLINGPGTNKNYWEIFTAYLNEYPDTEKIWWELCSSNETYLLEYENIIGVLDEVKRLAPGIKIYATRMPLFLDTVDEKCVENNGPVIIKRFVDQMILEGKVNEGPIMTKLNGTYTLPDGCHATEQGKVIWGKNLRDFFDSP